MEINLLNVIDRIYEVPACETDWASLLNNIADVCRTEIAWLVLSMPHLGMNTVIAPRSDPEIISEYLEHWWKKDVTLDATSTAPVGQITTLRDTGHDRFHASDFYNDFWRRSGHASERLATNLVTARGALSSIGVQPSRRENCVESDTARTFAALVPHLVRSVEVRCKMRKLELERDLARTTPAPGTVIVDAEARPLFCDDAAEKMIAASNLVVFEDGKLALRNPIQTAHLHLMVASCGGAAVKGIRGGQLSTFCEERGTSLHVEVLPVISRQPALGPELVLFPRATAILVLSDPTDRRRAVREALRVQFGLTPAEAAVALELLRGDGRQAAADRLGVSLATVRTHMMRIFEKTGAKSQAALIVRMADAGISIRPSFG